MRRRYSPPEVCDTREELDAFYADTDEQADRMADEAADAERER